MKLVKFLTVLLVLFFSVNLFAQDQGEEMTEEEWQAEMNRLTEKKADLTSELDVLQNDVNNLRKSQKDLQDPEDCMDELYSLVGATKADVDEFRREVTQLRKRIDNEQGPKEDVQAQLDKMQSNKISALPEFFDMVHNRLPKMMDAWKVEPKEVFYTVVKGDCLWNIAKMDEHYENPFAWPKIYESNKDKIDDPDLIYPKQVFKIPNLTEEEKAKYNKLQRNYKPTPMKAD
jgi:peptidoglycan hydrolase CwlO-like protein